MMKMEFNGWRTAEEVGHPVFAAVQLALASGYLLILQRVVGQS